VNPLQAYRAAKTNVDSDDKAKILVKARELLLEKREVVKMANTNRNYELKFSELSIITYAIQILNGCLDMTYGEIPKNLSALYGYLIRTLRHVQLNTDTKEIDDCKAIIAAIYEGFASAYKTSRRQDVGRSASGRTIV